MAPGVCDMNEFNKTADGRITARAQKVMDDLDSFISAFEVNKRGSRPKRLILSAGQMTDMWHPNYKHPKCWRTIPVVSQRAMETMREV